MKRVACFGEIMLRLSPKGYLRFQQADSFDAIYGGAEANVCASVAQLGLNARFITALPAHAIGQAAFNALRAIGVDTEYILRQGARVGIYFAEKGAAQRPSKVIYDRAGSAFSQIQPGEIDWDAALDGVDWFHFTGITPALGDNVAACVKEALAVAHKKNIRTSCDLNYRKNLWPREKAGSVMSELVQGLDLCIANEEDCKDVFGISAPESDINGGKLDNAGYLYVARRMQQTYGIREMAVTLRRSRSASDNDWAALLFDGEPHYSRSYPVHIVDRVGGGDSFGGALIYAKLCGYEAQRAVEFAAAASALKHTVEGDFNIISVDEAERLAGGDGSGRVQR
ncbi:MAG: sugar kinase [Clostridia bacterium]|nr:sugar kinase [Clostridia bacterium]